MSLCLASCVLLAPAEPCGLRVWTAAGMAPRAPRLSASWTLTSNLSVNYIACLRRAAEVGAEAEGGEVAA